MACQISYARWHSLLRCTLCQAFINLPAVISTNSARSAPVWLRYSISCEQYAASLSGFISTSLFQSMIALILSFTSRATASAMPDTSVSVFPSLLLPKTEYSGISSGRSVAISGRLKVLAIVPASSFGFRISRWLPAKLRQQLHGAAFEHRDCVLNFSRQHLLHQLMQDDTAGRAPSDLSILAPIPTPSAFRGRSKSTRPADRPSASSISDSTTSFALAKWC